MSGRENGREADGSDGEVGDESAAAGAPGDENRDGTREPVVRRYEPGDGAELRRIHDAAMRAAGTDPADIPGNDDLDRVDSAYIEPGGEFLVVEAASDDPDADREVVAMGGLAVDGDDLAPGEGELFRIAVDPEHQREGHGSRILRGLEAAARDRGLERVVLTTAKRQAAAAPFYRAHGYAEVGREHVDGYELVRFEKPVE